MPTWQECQRRKDEDGIQKECDTVMNDYCRSNPNNLDLCGCSANAYQKLPDAKMGKLNPKCWSDTCSTNPNAYRFKFNSDPCPSVCVDNSTINALGSNITDSQFKQSSCGGTNVDQTDPAAKRSIENLYKYGMIGVLTSVISFLLIFSMLSFAIAQ